MTVYFKCLCTSKDKMAATRLRNSGAVVRITNLNKEWRDEAKQYGLKLPIIVENGKARPLYE